MYTNCTYSLRWIHTNVRCRQFSVRVHCFEAFADMFVSRSLSKAFNSFMHLHYLFFNVITICLRKDVMNVIWQFVHSF